MLLQVACRYYWTQKLCKCSSIADGTVFAWGNNEYSQLGVDSSELQVLAPQQCHLPTLSEEIIQIASCGTFTCCLTGQVLLCTLLMAVIQSCVTHGNPLIMLSNSFLKRQKNCTFSIVEVVRLHSSPLDF